VIGISLELAREWHGSMAYCLFIYIFICLFIYLVNARMYFLPDNSDQSNPNYGGWIIFFELTRFNFDCFT